MACNKKEGLAVLELLAPLNLKEDVKEAMAAKAVSFNTSKIIGNWTDESVVTKFNKMGTFTVDEDGMYYPKVSISTSNNTAWIRKPDGGRLFLSKDPLDFIPGLMKTPMINWAINQMLGEKAGLITDTDLATINKADITAKMKDAINKKSFLNSIEKDEGFEFHEELDKQASLDALYDTALVQLSTYGVKLVTPDEMGKLQETRSEGVTEAYVDKATIDPLSRVSERLRLEFARIPKANSEGIIGVSELFPGVTLYEDPATIHKLFLKELVGSVAHTKDGTFMTRSEHMIFKLERLVNRHPGLAQFIDIIKSDPIFLADFTGAYALSLMDFTSAYQKGVEGGGTEINIGRTGARTSIEAQLKRNWYASFRRTVSNEKAGNITSNGAALKQIMRAHAELANVMDSNGDVPQAISDLFSAMGIEVTPTVADAMLDNFQQDNSDIWSQFELMLRPIAGALIGGDTSIIEDNTVIDIFEEFSKVSDRLALSASVFERDITANTEKGKDGKTYNKYAPSTGIHQAIERIKAGDRSALSALKDHPFYKGSLWLDNLTDEHASIEQLQERASKLEVFLFNLAKGDNGIADNKELTDTDQLIVQIRLAAVAFKGQEPGFLSPTAGDKSRAIGVRGNPTIHNGKIDGGVTFKSDTSFYEFNSEKQEFVVTGNNDKIHDGIVEQFTKYYQAEVDRINFEREGFFGHVSAIVDYMDSNSDINVITDPLEYYNEFNRVMTEVDLEYEVIANYHYKEDFISLKVIPLEEFQAALADRHSEDGKFKIMSAFTGNAFEHTMFEDGPTKNGVEADNMIREALAVRYTDMLNKFNGTILEVGKNGGLSSNYISGHINETLQYWLFNNMISNVEYHKMFTSDLAMYKGAVDYFKRVPSIYTDGQYLAVRNNSLQERIYNIAIIKDIKNPSQYIDNIRKAFANTEDPSKDQTALAEGYVSEINRGDGQAMITPNRWKFIMQRLGKWDDTLDNLFDRMVNDPYSLTGDELDSIKYMMKPLKGVASGINTEFGTPNQKYMKYSQNVIIPAFAKNTPMMELLYEMDPEAFRADGTYDTNKVYSENEHQNTVHELLFESAIKIGGSNITTIHETDPTNKSSFNLRNDLVLRGMPNYNADWKLQQDLPDHGISPTNVGSQIQSNIKGNIKMDGMYQVPGLIDDYTGVEILEMIDEITSKLSNLGLEKTRRDFGLDANNNIHPGKEQRYINMLLQQLEGKASPSEVAALMSGQSINSIPSLAGKAVTIFMSSVSKNAVKFKTSGTSLIQVSNVFSKLDEGTQRDIIYFDENGVDSLKPPMVGDNGKVTRGEAFMGFEQASKYLPKWETETFQEYGERFRENIDNGFFPIEMFEVALGYRIPNQNMSSNDSLKIVGILPPTSGDTIVLYDEIVTKTGSDFDIDKMFMMFNTVQPIYQQDSIYGIKKELYGYIDSNISNEDGDVTTIADYHILASELGVPTSAITEIFEDAEGEAFGGDRMVMLRDAVIEHFIAGTLAESDIHTAMTEHSAKYLSGYRIPNALVEYGNDSNAALGNALISLYRAVLESPHTVHDLLVPLDFAWLKDYTNALGFNTPPNTAKHLLFSDPIYQGEVKTSYRAGKMGIGQSANHVASHPLMQESGGKLTTPLSFHFGESIDADGKQVKGLYELDKEWEVKFDSEESYDSLRGKDGSLLPVQRLKITQSLSTFLNAYVDIAKDPYVTAANFNTGTFNAGALMLRAGMPKEVVFAFISSFRDSKKSLSKNFVFKTDRKAGESDEFGDVDFDIDFDMEGDYDMDDFVEPDVDFADTDIEVDVDGDADIIDFEALIDDVIGGKTDALKAMLVWEPGGSIYLTPTQMLIWSRDGKLTGEDALNTLTGKEMDNESIEVNYADTMKYVRTISKSLTQTMQAHKMSDGVGITVSEMVVKDNMMKDSLDKDKTKLAVSTVKRLRERDGAKTMIGTQWDNTMEVIPKLSPILFQFDRRFRRFLNGIKFEPLQRGDLELAQFFEKEALGSVYNHTDFGLKNDNYMEDLFSPGENGLAQMVLDAKDDYKENIFIQNIEVDSTDPDYSFLTFAQLSMNDPLTREAFQDSFAELESYNKELFERLLQYSVYANAMTMKFGSFEQYIPIEVSYKKKFDVAITGVQRSMEDHFNADKVREIFLNNPMMSPHINLSKDGLALSRLSTEAYPQASYMVELQSLTKKAGYDITDVDGKMKTNLPGHNNAWGPKDKAWTPAIVGVPYRPGVAGQSAERFIRTFAKGITQMYEIVGSISNEYGQTLVYTQVEGKGYKSRKGRTIKEYGISVSKIESNHFYNKETIDGEAEVMRNEMKNLRGALIKAISKMNAKDKYESLVPVCRA